MSAVLAGDVYTIHFELTVDQVDTEATDVVITLVKPDGTVETLSVTNTGTGLYNVDVDTTNRPAGHYVWVAMATGTAQAVATGMFDLIDPFSFAVQLTAVQPWTDATAVRERPGCAAVEQRTLDDCARAATDILYALSGRQYAGRNVATVRPVAARLGDRRPPGMWFASWGTCAYGYATGYGAAWLSGWAGHTCRARPASVELGGYPVTQILTVKVDGVTIPADEYAVYDHRHLVRTLPTATSTPTARAGWPTCQRLDLPDTEPGTFSVEFAYGTPPPRAGVLAASTLAAELALAVAPGGSDTRLPERVRTLVRQGESVTLIDPQDVLDQGRTGIPEVDLFLKAVNPAGLIGRSSAWSPDMGSARRQT